MLSLKKPYVRVQREYGQSYGGSQMWSSRETIRLCGCGPVAVFDTLLYLTGRNKEPLPEKDYLQELTEITRRYFPLVKPFGINGIMLALGFNRLLMKHQLPYRAFWAVSGRKFWDRILDLLEQDVPVILSVGPNFPAVWSKHRLQFYRKAPNGAYLPSSSTRAHYITATGIDETWLRISSWGQEYYIRRSEYDEYVRRYSASLVSNVMMLRKIG